MGMNDPSIIKNEPMFFNSDLDFAYSKGGMITKSFIDNLPNDWRHGEVVFDSRVHMLMPGWYPCIPGYHHDDIPRSTDSGQPNYNNPEYHSEHILGLINGQICPTKFAIGECEVSFPVNDDVIYKVWHDEIKDHIKNGKLTEIDAPSNLLIYFDCDTFHSGDKAVGNEWRWFGRVSRNTDRVKSITNEIRNQVQVYLEFPTQGW